MRNHTDPMDYLEIELAAQANFRLEQRRAAEERDVAEWQAALDAGSYDRPYEDWRREK